MKNIKALGGAAIVAALVASAVALVMMDRRDKPDIVAWPGPQEREIADQAHQDGLWAAARLVGPLEKEIIEAFVALNQAELRQWRARRQGGEEAGEGGAAKAREQLDRLTRKYLRSHGPRSLYHVGLTMVAPFLKGVEDLCRQASSGERGISELTMGLSEKSSGLDAVRDYGGTFVVEIALPSGLISERGAVRAHREGVIPVLFKSRWSMLLGRDSALAMELDGPSRRAYLSWLAMDAGQASLPRRLEACQALGRMDNSFPMEVQRALILAENGQLDGALRALKEAQGAGRDPEPIERARVLITTGEGL